MLILRAKDEFKKYGIKTSLQRVKIFNYLNRSMTHPSVDDIYSELVKEIPSLSKTTVYNNLSLFIEKGLAREIKIDKHLARYELNRGLHGHFMCENCGEISDFEALFINEDPENLKGFDIRTKNLYYTGLCSACKKSLKALKH